MKMITTYKLVDIFCRRFVFLFHLDFEQWPLTAFVISHFFIENMVALIELLQ